MMRALGTANDRFLSSILLLCSARRAGLSSASVLLGGARSSLPISVSRTPRRGMCLLKHRAVLLHPRGPFATVTSTFIIRMYLSPSVFFR